MSTLNPDFYDLNTLRAYPVSDEATLLTDDGRELPHNLLVDANLRFPDTLGQYVFVSSISTTPALLSLTLQVSASIDGGDFIPLASANIPDPASQRYRVLALTPHQPGVGGWIVIGVPDLPFAGRFSTPGQSLLLPHLARKYKAPAVSSVGRFGAAAPLKGIVRLRGEAPLEIVGASMLIANQTRKVALFQLVQSTAASLSVTGGSDATNPLAQYAGPCLGAAESLNCGEPQPIQTIQNVAPNCDGILVLEFTGCADIAAVETGSGFVIDCALGLKNACPAPYIPSETGVLPDEMDAEIVTAGDTGGGSTPGSNSDQIVHDAELPFVTCFRGGLPYGFTTVLGFWQFDADHSPAPACGSGSGAAYSIATSSTLSLGHRNLSIWEGFDAAALGRTISADVKMLSLPPSTTHNAYIVFNCHPLSSAAPSRFIVGLDHDTQSFMVQYFNGVSSRIIGSVALPYLLTDVWYTLSVTLKPGSEFDQRVFTGRVTLLTVPVGADPVDVTVGPFPFFGLSPFDGYPGVETVGAASRFTSFQVSEAL